MKVSLKNRARLNLADIASWYAEQRVDLAEAFKREFLVCIERISLQPNMYPEAEDGLEDVMARLRSRLR